VAVDVGSITGPLAEGAYLGATKGSHSMATEDRPGVWRQANGGTLFLDELANMPEAVQQANLRVMQEREVRAIGATGAHKVDVDVVAATNRDMLAEIRAGRFKMDLYYRLAAEVVTLPPLRARREEIPWLVDAMLREKQSSRRPSMEFLLRALRYDWPGNVRQLKIVVGQALRDERTSELAGAHVPAPVNGALDETASMTSDLEAPRQRVEGSGGAGDRAGDGEGEDSEVWD
jgi:transcriptional regulator with PAS, ATPase and Fis domain